MSRGCEFLREVVAFLVDWFLGVIFEMENK
jgi:hypothetical protein